MDCIFKICALNATEKHIELCYDNVSSSESCAAELQLQPP